MPNIVLLPVALKVMMVDNLGWPTDLAAHLDALRRTVRGKIVLVGAHQKVPVTFNDMPERHDDGDVLRILLRPTDGVVDRETCAVRQRHHLLMDGILRVPPGTVHGSPTTGNDVRTVISDGRVLGLEELLVRPEG